MLLKHTSRQTWVLMQKNLRIYARSPLTTLVRALIFPILATILLCLSKQLGETDLIAGFVDKSGIATSSQPIKALADAISATSNQKLVFVRNGVAAGYVDPIIDGVMVQPNMENKTHVVLDDPSNLFLECQQTLRGLSNCFAAVIFTSYNNTNAEYIIAVDSSVGAMDADQKAHTSVAIDRLMPLKWAIDSQIGNFTTTTRPAELPWQGIIASRDSIITTAQSALTNPPNPWFNFIGLFIAPVFLLPLMGIVYHLSLSVATERQSGISELLAAHTCSTTPRILSTLLSFTLLYLPGWVGCSVLITRLLFTRCSDILFLILTLLATLAMTSSTHLVASFFRKAQLSGLYTSTLMFALAFVTIAFTMDRNPNLLSIQILSGIFPPIAYATLIGDIARAETRSTGYSLSVSDVPVKVHSYDYVYPQFAGYFYAIFFTVQIVVYTAATFGVEKYLWGVKRPFNIIPANSDVALRCIKLSKTFDAKCHWYWPFNTASRTSVVAVNDLDFDLRKGSVSFLLGPNGGGKTTTLKCIAGMTVMDPTSSLEINEDSLAFGVCPQGNVFWPKLTVMENINIWRKIKTVASNEKDDESDTLVECDLLDKKDAAAESLSGGQMRKLQLAVAFVGGSKICCIDEATSGLDPLSRRNIWNIISKGRSRRTVLMTTHFLDEADVLADHISIVCKGSMICSGSPTSLKAAYGGNYIISEIQSDNKHENARTWQMTSSANATKQLLELEGLSNNSYTVTFPTLEQVFLRVTQSGNIFQGVVGEGTADNKNAAVHVNDTLLGDEEQETDQFDTGRAVGLFGQIAIILRKRYILLRHNWISFSIAVAVPLVIAAGLSSILHYLPSFTTCESNLASLTSSGRSIRFGSLNPPSTSSPTWLGASAVVGPPEAFEGLAQNTLYTLSTETMFRTSSCNNISCVAGQVLGKRLNASSLDMAITQIVSLSGRVGFGIFAATPDNATIIHQISAYDYFSSPQFSLTALNVVTNRVANASATNGPARVVQTTYRTFQHVTSGANFRILPVTLLVLLGLITSTSVSINYPTYERINNMRALQYCNGVSPMALWVAYLIFDMQITVFTSAITFGLVFTGPAARLWFAPVYLLGAMLLFGLATYLGSYVLSLFIRRAAFAVAAGLHTILFIFYIFSYALNQNLGPPTRRAGIYNKLQAGLGLTSPAANLGRAFFIATNNFDLACGETGYTIQNPFAYNLYGGVYTYLLIQIIFLSTVLFLIEYSSIEWIHKLRSKLGSSTRTPSISLEEGPPESTLNDDILDSTPGEKPRDTKDSILVMSKVSKQFGKITAVENASLEISPDEVFALLGSNGAGKTTTINMIRGLIKPNNGSIHLDGISVIDHPQEARIHLGVCPQDDAIDELTVRQTLNFFARIKGVKDVGKNVDRIMRAFQITQFEKFSVKKLSGGTRRKLMAGIALTGNPRVLLLDEPSTGLDAGAKRVLWKILHSLSSGRAVLLTTHSMEEVEALATKVAIMNTRILASGSLPSMRNRYGGFYRVNATYSSQTSDTDAERLIIDKFKDQVSNLVIRHGEASFELPHDSRQLGKTMSAMESLMKSTLLNTGIETSLQDEGGAGLSGSFTAGFEDYTISEPTMEMIFMNVCLNAGRERG